MNYSNHQFDSISTVQLSPFNEDQWNRIVTYSPFYVHWTDLVLMSRKQKPSSSGRRNVIGLIDMNTIKLEDDMLLTELQDIRKSVVIPSLTTIKEKDLYHKSKSRDDDDEHDRRPSSPSDEYQNSSDFFYQTRVPPKLNCTYTEPSFSHPQQNTKHAFMHSQTNSNGSIKGLPNINLGPKPQASLSVQLRQSAIARENALATSTDHRSISPASVTSSKRAAGCSAHSGRRVHQQYRVVLHSQATLLPAETNVVGGFFEQPAVDSSSSIKKSYARSSNTSRSTIHMLKTKNDRARQKQHVELKTVLVKPCRQPAKGDAGLEDAIPNSIEIMRKSGGPISTFEKTLRFNYHRQLNQYRNNSTKF